MDPLDLEKLAAETAERIYLDGFDRYTRTEHEQHFARLILSALQRVSQDAERRIGDREPFYNAGRLHYDGVEWIDHRQAERAKEDLQTTVKELELGFRFNERYIGRLKEEKEDLRRALDPPMQAGAPRYHGPCANCGMPLVIPEGQVWGLGEPKQHPWEGMCVQALKAARRRALRALREKLGDSPLPPTCPTCGALGRTLPRLKGDDAAWWQCDNGHQRRIETGDSPTETEPR